MTSTSPRQTVERVVRTALRLAHRRDLIERAGPGGLPGACFRLPELPGAWADARNDGLLHPVTGRERPVTFDRDAAAERTDVVLLHLGHRLVQMCLRLLRAELWAGATRAGKQRGLTGSPPASCPGTCCAPRRSSATSAWSSPARRAPGCTRRSSSPAAPSRPGKLIRAHRGRPARPGSAAAAEDSRRAGPRAADRAVADAGRPLSGFLGNRPAPAAAAWPS